MKAALYVAGRVVVADSHLACFQTLTEEEKDADMDSGFYDSDTGQFISDNERSVFDDKELYLVRHAQAACPDEHDPDITEEGAEQVRIAAHCLLKRNLSGFQGVASPMLRCLRTASILNNMLGIKFAIIPEIMEIPSFLKGDEVFKLKNRSRMFPQFEWPCSGEWHVMHETKTDFYGRVKDTLHQMPSHSIVVTHYGYICLTAKIALSKKILQEGFPPASVTYFHRHDAERLGWTHEEVSEDRSATADRQARRSDGSTGSHPGELV